MVVIRLSWTLPRNQLQNEHHAANPLLSLTTRVLCCTSNQSKCVRYRIWIMLINPVSALRQLRHHRRFLQRVEANNIQRHRRAIERAVRHSRHTTCPTSGTIRMNLGNDVPPRLDNLDLAKSTLHTSPQTTSAASCKAGRAEESRTRRTSSPLVACHSHRTALPARQRSALLRRNPRSARTNGPPSTEPQSSERGRSVPFSA